MAFLAIALLVHAALFLLPLKNWKTTVSNSPPRLTVDLRQLPPPDRPEVDPEGTPIADPLDETVLLEQPKPEPRATERHTARIALEELPAKPAELPPAVATEQLTAQQLRDLIRRAQLHNDASETDRQLGSARPYQPPANWDKNAGAPYLADFDNRFNGMTVPAEVEIVDRWLASDGSHNVVVNLPNGDTVCGRAEAYNPMQPLVEPIMMFRACGGGGKRTFSVPDRYKKGQ